MTVTADRVGAYTIDEVHVEQLSDDELRPVAELEVAGRLEMMPDEPPMPVELAMTSLRATPKQVIRRGWVARDGSGRAVGRAMIIRFDTPENPNFREGGVHVLTEHRRRGIGKALFARMVGGAGDADDIVITSGTASSVPAGEEFAKRVGAKSTLVNRVSEVGLTKIDPAMIREWSAIDPKGYRLEWIDGDVPDELLPQVMHAYDLMNTAPKDDMEMDDWKTTPELIREWDARRTKMGSQRRLLLAIAENGEAAGFTETSYNHSLPHVVGQQGTAVDPAHRGHGIGKWIKARMIERVMRDFPSATIIRTGNAYSNAPMLSINDRLGFKVTLSFTVWQVKLPDAKRYLAEGRSG